MFIVTVIYDTGYVLRAQPVLVTDDIKKAIDTARNVDELGGFFSDSVNVIEMQPDTINGRQPFMYPTFVFGRYKETDEAGEWKELWGYAPWEEKYKQAG